MSFPWLLMRAGVWPLLLPPTYAKLIRCVSPLTKHPHHLHHTDSLDPYYGRPWRDTLQRLHRAPSHVDISTLTFLLRCCTNAKTLFEGKLVHAHIIKNGHGNDTFLGNLLVRMYGECGSLAEAREVFDKIQTPNLFSWTAILAAYCRHGHGKEVCYLFRRMLLEGFIPNEFVFISVFSACSNPVSLDEGKRIHGCIVGTAMEMDVFVGTALVNMYGKCGCVDDARQAFDKIREPNVISWTTMIAACARHGYNDEAFQLFQQMQLEGVIPNKVTFLSILEACTSQATIAEGKQLHNLIINSGLDSDVVIGNALISMYQKCGLLYDAQKMFYMMTNRNVVSWTTIISAYAQHGKGVEALQLFYKMQLQGVAPDKIIMVRILSVCSTHGAFSEGKLLHACIVDSGFEADVLVGNALVTMYGKFRSLDNAERVFDNMPDHNLISWNSLISSYIQDGNSKEGLRMFKKMQFEGVITNRSTLVSILSAFTSQTPLTEGKVIHAQILDSGFESDVVLGNALINMYCMCGTAEDAMNMFSKISERDVFTWTTIIKAYTQHGKAEKAIELFQDMLLEGVMPNKVTFICILSACINQAGLAAGKLIHSQIVNSAFASDVFVGNALINMYISCGKLEDAWKLFSRMPLRDVTSWNVMIAAYAQNGLSRKSLRLYSQMQLEGIMPDKFTFVSILDACNSQLTLAECKRIHSCIATNGLELDVLVGNALVNMYGKCGSLNDARMIFDKIQEQNTCTWNALITAYSRHGGCKEVLQIFQEMQLTNVIPDNVTFIGILSSCSYAGSVDNGCYCFVSMSLDYGIRPSVKHYNCMIKLLRQSGQLDESENLIANMPFRPTSISWISLFGRDHPDLHYGIYAANHASESGTENAAPYVMPLSLYDTADTELMLES